MSGLPDLGNQFFFPRFSSLPLDAGFITFYDDSDDDFIEFDKSKPRFRNRSYRKHWCTFAEIIQDNQWPVRPVYKVKDLSGRQYLVSFYFDDQSLFPDVMKKCKVGSTLCIMYAERHEFMDGTEGVKISQPDAVKVLPVNLKDLMAAGHVFRARIKNVPSSTTPALCSNCNKPAEQRCSACTLSVYCSKECQSQDWAKKHKKECVVFKQLKLWDVFDWHKYDFLSRPNQLLSCSWPPILKSASVTIGVLETAGLLRWSLNIWDRIRTKNAQTSNTHWKRSRTRLRSRYRSILRTARSINVDHRNLHWSEFMHMDGSSNVGKSYRQL